MIEIWYKVKYSQICLDTSAHTHIHTYLQNCILKVLLSPIGANFELIPAHFENMEIFSWFFLQFFDESVSAKFQ
jgi:hypothetical protein